MIETSRTKNSIRNIFWGILLRVSVILLPFINRTVIIKTLGMEYSGIASLFSSILSVLNLAELGVNSAILFTMYKTVAEEEVRKTNALLNYYRKVYRIIGTVILVLGIIICFRLELFIAGDYPNDINIYIVFLIYLSNAVSSYFFFAYMSVVLIANQREDISHRINLVISISCAILQLFVLLMFKNYYIYVLLTVLSSVVFNFCCYAEAKKRYPQYYASGTLDINEKRVLKKQITGLVIGKLSVVSRNSFDGVIISSYLGLIPTAIYGNYYYVMSSLFSIVFLFCSGIRASVGNKIATQDVEENYTDMMIFSYGFYVIYGTCTVCLFCGYQNFMELWVGIDYMASIGLAALMSLYFFLFCSIGIISQYWESAGLFWENRHRYIVEAVINLVFDLVMVRLWGINGVIFATIISMGLITNIIGPIIAFKHYFTHCSIKKYFSMQLVYLIVTMLLSILCYAICSYVNFNKITGFVIKCSLSFLVAGTVNMLLFIKSQYSKDLRNIIVRSGIINWRI